MEELRECPFCGGEAFIRKNKDLLETYSAYCGNEDCSASPKVSAYGKEMVVGLWNKRADADIRAKAIEEFAERLKKASIKGAFEYKPDKDKPWYKVRSYCKVVGTRKIDEIAEQMKEVE